MAEAKQKVEEVKKQRVRSPAYPYVDLPEAVQRAQGFYDSHRRGAASLELTSRQWGFKGAGSVPQQVVAALKYYGLMEDVGKGKDRKVRLTDAAFRILLDQSEDSTERAEAIQKAALSPKIHADLWATWGADLPPDGQIKNYLVFEKHFNPDVVDAFIKVYKTTIAFAKLAESGTLPSDNIDKNEDQDIDPLQGLKMDTNPPGGKPRSGEPPQDDLQYRLSKDGVALVYRGRVTKQVMRKLISYLQIDLDTLPDPAES